MRGRLEPCAVTGGLTGLSASAPTSVTWLEALGFYPRVYGISVGRSAFLADKSAFSLADKLYGARYLLAALNFAFVNDLNLIRIEDEIDFKRGALHRAGYRRFAELTLVRSRQFVARLFQFENGSAGALGSRDRTIPRSGHIHFISGLSNGRSYNNKRGNQQTDD
jgi:hypothetical protein